MLHRSAASYFRRTWVSVSFLAIMVAFVWTGRSALASTWDHSHGDAANSGFADVITRPARSPSKIVRGLGSFAPGAGPVIGPDGTVYVGNEQGVLWAFHPDGTPYWNQPLGVRQSIQASPVVDTDGSIYVVGESTYTDHRVSPAVKRTDSTLYHFAPTGGTLWTRPFPEHFAGTPEAASRGVTSAAPNIWREGSYAAIIVPAVYKGLGGDLELYLLAFPTDGGAPREQNVIDQAQVVSGDDGGILGTVGCILSLCFLHPGFSPTIEPPNPADQLPERFTAPMASVGIFTSTRGSLPWVIVNDPWQETLGYTFSTESGFMEMFRHTDATRAYAASPLLLPDGHSVTAATDVDMDSAAPGRIVFTGPNGPSLPSFGTNASVVAAPARTADQRLVVATESGEIIFLKGSTLIASAQLPGQTIASPAVSRSHVFISTVSSLRTFNALTMTEVGRLDWAGGGLSGPAIGPSGSVYAWPPIISMCSRHRPAAASRAFRLIAPATPLTRGHPMQASARTMGGSDRPPVPDCSICLSVVSRRSAALRLQQFPRAA